MNKNYFLLVALICCCSLLSFEWDSTASSIKKTTALPVDPTCADTISFQDDIAPLFNRYCSGCHNENNEIPHTFHDYSSIAYGAPEAISAMKRTGFGAMPADGTPVPDSLISLVECWVQIGRPNN